MIFDHLHCSASSNEIVRGSRTQLSKWVGVAFFLVVFMLGAFEAKGGPPKQEIEAAKAELEKLILADSDPIKQSNVLIAVHRQSDKNFDRVLSEVLLKKVNEITPVGLFVLADRLADIDGDEALFWYAVASIRARYDGFRCADKTAAQGVPTIHMIAPRASQLVEEEPEKYSEAGKRALVWEDLFSGKLEPSWICISGLGIFSGGSPRAYTDQREWPKLRTDLLARYGKYFTDLALPDDDPTPWADTRPSVIRIADPTDLKDFAWLDSETLVFSVHVSDQAHDHISLRKWTPGSEAMEILTFPRGEWCAGNGTIVYQTARENDPKNREFRTEFMTLADGKGTPGTIVGERWAVWASVVGEFSDFRSDEGTHYVQSPFDCRWEFPETLMKRYMARYEEFGGAAVLPLRKGDGYLVMDFGRRHEETVTGGGTAVSYIGGGGIAHFPDQASESFELPFKKQGFEDFCVRYFEFADAYSISFCSIGPDLREEFRQQECIPSWWFRPKIRDVEKVCTEVDEVDDNFSVVAPVRRGTLKFVDYRKTARAYRTGGIYRRGDDGKAEKIYEGWLDGFAVSPDGCRVAAKWVPMKDGKAALRGGGLDVVDLCEAEVRRAGN